MSASLSPPLRKTFIYVFHHFTEPVIQSAISLEKANRNKKFQYLPEAYRTVVVMPFLGGAMGAGHSELGSTMALIKN